MTGKELIIYILQNNLEDEDVMKNGIFVGFINIDQAAAKFDVGVETIRTWTLMDMLSYVKVRDYILFPANIEDPRNMKG